MFASVLAVCSLYMVLSPKNPLVSFGRVILPWTRIGAPTRVAIDGVAPGDTAALCGAVFTQLKQVIEAEVKRFEDRPALDLEVEAHDRFAEERCRIFTGRQPVLDTIADYLRGPERRPLVLHGESGSGKSAVMAKASQQYTGPGWVIRQDRPLEMALSALEHLRFRDLGSEGWLRQMLHLATLDELLRLVLVLPTSL